MSDAAQIVVLATLDTKGSEAAYVAEDRKSTRLNSSH